MRIEFLGTGTSQGIPVINCDCPTCLSIDPKDSRLRCSIVIQSNRQSIIIDVGPDFRQQMLRSKTKKIDNVLLTHEHNDHIIGLDDLRPFNFVQKMDIPIHGLSRVLEDVKLKFHYAFTKSPYPGAPGYRLIDLAHGDCLQFDDIHVTAFEVMHGDLPILCYRLNDFVYITDAKTIDKKSMSIIEGCDTLVVNALRFKEHWSHFTLDEALAFINRVKPQKAYLTHMSHLLGAHEDISKKLPSNVFLAYDGLTLNV